MRPLLAIAMSGGVDSTMAAYLSKKQGYPVVGIHFITGYEETDHSITGSDNATHTETRKKAALRKMAPLSDRLKIPVEIVDIQREFENTVVNYFTRTYEAGQTPNPCMVCNPTIKFGALFGVAQKLGAKSLITGHYARIVQDKDGRCHLKRGIDPKKEQSYFLARLTQQQLAHAHFPLGDYSKPQVKQLAKDKGFSSLTKDESQDVCFINQKTYGEFLYQKRGIGVRPGEIIDVEGNVIGAHKGLHLFTIGQRRGINCPAPEPYYVVRIDMKNNRLVVGHRKDLLSRRCRVADINWIVNAPATPITVRTRVRYRHTAAPSMLHPIDSQTAVVTFREYQSAITPGQCAVFYQNDEVLGGGWIENE